MIIESDAVELVIVAQVLRELDEKKDGDSEKLKKRAKRALAKLNSWLPPRTSAAGIADGVTIRVLPAEPPERPGLDYRVADDRILGSVFDLANGADVCVATGDTTMRFKAEHHQIAVFVIPDEYRIRDDEPKREARHAPRLIAGLFGADRQNAQNNVAVKPGISVRHLFPAAEEALIEARRREAEDEHDDALALEHENAGLFGGAVGSKNAALMRSLRGLRKASALYSGNPVVNEITAQSWERYIQRLVEFQKEHHYTARIEIGIVNQGTAPADDVIVEFQFPPHIKVSLHEPRIPNAPREERLSDLSMIVPNRLSVDTAKPESIELDDRAQGVCARVRVKRLMHSRVVAYPVWIGVQAGFTIEVVVLAASPPVQEAAALNVRLSAS